MTIAGILVALAFFSGFIKNKKVAKFRDKFLSNIHFIPLAAFAFALFFEEGDMIYDQMIELFAITLIVGMPFEIGYRISRKSRAKKDSEEELKPSLPPIPSSVEGRTNIVAAFSEKYGLRLTASQIATIVNCSFTLKGWENEIRAMNYNYHTIHEWYAGNPSWLRAYLKAFSIQNVVADLTVQRDICLKSFEEVFSAFDMKKYATVTDLVWDINDKFMTNFDDVTFMIAYRLLKGNGKEFELPSASQLNYKSDMEKLMAEYDEQAPMYDVDRELEKTKGEGNVSHSSGK